MGEFIRHVDMSAWSEILHTAPPLPNQALELNKIILTVLDLQIIRFWINWRSFLSAQSLSPDGLRQSSPIRCLHADKCQALFRLDRRGKKNKMQRRE